MKWNSRIRCALVCLAFTGLFSAFSFRLVYLQMVKHDEYSALAANTHVDKHPIFAERGAIVDANGDVLAHDLPGELVYVDATHVNDAEKLTPLLATSLNLPAAEVSEKLATGRAYIVLQHQVPQATTA